MHFQFLAPVITSYCCWIFYNSQANFLCFMDAEQI